MYCNRRASGTNSDATGGGREVARTHTHKPTRAAHHARTKYQGRSAIACGYVGEYGVACVEPRPHPTHKQTHTNRCSKPPHDITANQTAYGGSASARRTCIQGARDCVSAPKKQRSSSKWAWSCAGAGGGVEVFPTEMVYAGALVRQQRAQCLCFDVRQGGGVHVAAAVARGVSTWAWVATSLDLCNACIRPALRVLLRRVW
jgi:hypothetical protein